MARVRGVDRLSVGIATTSRAIRTEVTKAVYVAADVISVEAATSITKGSVSGKGHVPSAPGEPPNADTRQLDTNIITVADATRTAAQSISQAPYSAFLEYGTGKMAARPFMRPALANKSDEARAMIQQAVKRATKS